MNVTDLVGLVALLVKTVDTLRFATAKQVNGVVTQLLAWAAGVGGVFIVAQTQWAAHISVGNGTTLAHQGAFSLVAIGLSIASSGSVLKDVQAALDNSNSAALPPLVQSAAQKAAGILGNASAVSLGGDFANAPQAMEKLRNLISEEVGKVGPSVASAIRTAASGISVATGSAGGGGAKVAGVDVPSSGGGGGVKTDVPSTVIPSADAPAPADVHPDFAPSPDMPLPPPIPVG